MHQIWKWNKKMKSKERLKRKNRQIWKGNKEREIKNKPDFGREKHKIIWIWKWKWTKEERMDKKLKKKDKMERKIKCKRSRT